MYAFFAESIADASSDASYSRWKIRWSGSKPSLRDLESKTLSELVSEPNLLITAYYDFSNRILPSARYDVPLAEAGLAPSLDVSRPVATDALRRTLYTEFPLMTAVRLFFRPNVIVQEAVERVLSRAQGYHLIGFQIRMGSGSADFTDSHTFLKMDAVQRFVERGEEYRIQRGIEASRVKWFISTDSSKVERKLRQLYPERVLVADGLHRGHSQQKSSSLTSFRRAVVDLSVLSHCEYLVLTNHSSFGMIARMVSPSPLFSIVPARGY